MLALGNLSCNGSFCRLTCDEGSEIQGNAVSVCTRLHNNSVSWTPPLGSCESKSQARFSRTFATRMLRKENFKTSDHCSLHLRRNRGPAVADEVWWLRCSWHSLNSEKTDSNCHLARAYDSWLRNASSSFVEFDAAVSFALQSDAFDNLMKKSVFIRAGVCSVGRSF